MSSCSSSFKNTMMMYCCWSKSTSASHNLAQHSGYGAAFPASKHFHPPRLDIVFNLESTVYSSAGTYKPVYFLANNVRISNQGTK